jgi:hypothetical protein
VIPEGAKLSPVWNSHEHNFSLPAPPYFEPPNMSKEERKVWYATWSHSAPGQAYLAWQKDRRFHAVVFAADGSFRIEDVQPGTYELQIRPTGADIRGGPVAHGEFIVIVPEIVEGDLEKPIDMGTIKLKPGAK